LDGPLPFVGVVCGKRLLEEIPADLTAEFFLVDLEGLDLLAALIKYGDFDHG
jgi:hypothetical protein